MSNDCVLIATLKRRHTITILSEASEVVGAAEADDRAAATLDILRSSDLLVLDCARRDGDNLTRPELKQLEAFLEACALRKLCLSVILVGRLADVRDVAKRLPRGTGVVRDFAHAPYDPEALASLVKKHMRRFRR